MSLPGDVTREMHTTPLTRGINLMCYLTDGVTYVELYQKPLSDGSPTSALGKIIANAQALDQHPELQTDPDGNRYDVKAELVGPKGVLTQIEAILQAAGYPDVHLGDLFLAKAKEGTPLAEIVRLFQEFFVNAGGRMNHFCTPFMYMQEKDTYVTAEDWEDFTQGLGNTTLGQLYLSSDDTLRKHAQRARESKILVDNSKSVGNYTPGGGNGRWCIENQCVESGNPQTWCNMVEDGSECSAMSTHGP